MQSRHSAGAASWPPAKNVSCLLLLLLGCSGVQSISPATKLTQTTKSLSRTPLLHKVSKAESPPPPHPWTGSGLSEKVLSAGSIAGALFHAFLAPVLGKAPIINTTTEAWTPLEEGRWGANNGSSSSLHLAAVHDSLTDELEKEVKMESEHHQRPNSSKVQVVANPKVDLVLSNASSLRVRAPGSSQAISSDMQDAEFELMGQLLRNAKNFFAFEGSLVLAAVGLSNLHHIHVIEANAQTLNNLMEKPEVQSAVHEGRLVLTGQPLAQDTLFPSPTSCVPGQVQAAFEADWDLIFLGKECSADEVVRNLKASSSNVRVAVLGQGGTISDQSILESYDKVEAAGSLAVFARKDVPKQEPNPQSAEKPETKDSGMGIADAIAPLMHGEGLWPH